MSNHGQVGEALYLKFSKEKFENLIGKNINYIHGDVISVDTLDNEFGISAAIPVHIDNNTKGEYECVCEHGVEVW